jgi:prolyl-tRNA synthetase
VRDALERYYTFSKEYLAIETVRGEKTALERFPGADTTLSIEGLMRDGKVLQMGTSHHLGQRFAKSFDITFLDKDNKRKYPWQTSWGVSTRLIGALIMAHGDEKGLILPPKIAPFQAVVIPIYKTSKEKTAVLSFVDKEIKPRLSALRMFVDDREQHTPGWKFNQWELKGVPLRIEVGPRDVAATTVTLANRLTHQKDELPVAGIEKKISKELDTFHALLYERSRTFVTQHTYESDSLSEIVSLVEKQPGLYRAGWCGSKACEEKIQQTEVTIRNIPLTSTRERACAVCGKKGKEIIIAKAY